MKFTIRPWEINEGLARGEFFLEYLQVVSLIDQRCIETNP
jgi:hypothetical protein